MFKMELDTKNYPFFNKTYLHKVIKIKYQEKIYFILYI